MMDFEEYQREVLKICEENAIPFKWMPSIAQIKASYALGHKPRAIVVTIMQALLDRVIAL